MEFGVWALGFGVFIVSSFGFRVSGSVCGVQNLGCGVSDSGSRAPVLGLRVEWTRLASTYSISIEDYSDTSLIRNFEPPGTTAGP